MCSAACSSNAATAVAAYLRCMRCPVTDPRRVRGRAHGRLETGKALTVAPARPDVRAKANTTTTPISSTTPTQNCMPNFRLALIAREPVAAHVTVTI